MHQLKVISSYLAVISLLIIIFQYPVHAKEKTPPASTKDQTYLMCYGIKDSFTLRSDLIRKDWGLNPDKNYTKLRGYWKDNHGTATTENYFVVNNIAGQAVKPENVKDKLTAICRQTIKDSFSADYTKNITYFASDSSLGYEYPLLTQVEASTIASSTQAFSYHKILRYAYAAKYAYAVEKESAYKIDAMTANEACPDKADDKLKATIKACYFPFYGTQPFSELMLDKGKLEIVGELRASNSGLYAVAIKVPAIADKALEEEIIIAYKGTSNLGDVGKDIQLGLQNIAETNGGWQKDAENFYQQIVKKYPPNKRSIANGYHQPKAQASSSYNVVITGHSLGAYTAAGVGGRSGVLTRVFSSPGTHIIRKYTNLLSNTMRLNNVINFVRQGDPVSTLTGRHDENMIYYPAAAFAESPDNHFLVPFIKDIIEKLYQNPQDTKAMPRYIYVTPDAVLGGGLEKRINDWGN